MQNTMGIMIAQESCKEINKIIQVGKIGKNLDTERGKKGYYTYLVLH